MDNNEPLPKSVLGVQVNVGLACAFGVPLKLVGALAGDTVKAPSMFEAVPYTSGVVE